MTKLKDAPEDSFLGFRIRLDRLIFETMLLTPAWITPEMIRSCIDPSDFTEHLPYHAIRHHELAGIFRADLEKNLTDAGVTPAQLRSAPMQRHIESEVSDKLQIWGAWERQRLTEPKERERRAWCAAGIYLAFGRTNRSEAARICNLGISRADRRNGIQEEAIRNALYSITRWRNPLGRRFRHQMRVEIAEAGATRWLWNDLAEGNDSLPGRRRLEKAAEWRRSGKLYVRFHEHFVQTGFDAETLERCTYHLAGIALPLRQKREGSRATARSTAS